MRDAAGFRKSSIITLSLLLSIASASIFASERIRKFDLALKTLGIPSEKEPDFSQFPQSGAVSSSDVLSIEKYVDPDRGLRRYLDFQPGRIALYPDFRESYAETSRDQPEYELSTGNTENEDSPELIEHLSRIAANVQTSSVPLPLTGFRVLIDPGHMGAPYWENKTGKYVKVGGKTVNEGQITFWTAMLVANEYEKLGAEVRLTRTGYAPVTPYRLQNFDPTDRTRIYYYKSLDDWMTKYLDLSDSQLVRRLPSAAEVRMLRTQEGRLTLFLLEDLEARMRIADTYQPDLFISLHFDSQKINRLQSDRRDVEINIPGAFRKNETGSRNDRAMMLKHYVEVRRWRQNARIAESLVTQVATHLGLPLMKDAGEVPTTVKVTDGVFTRNLYELKRLNSGMGVLLESLHFDHVKEFPQLTVLNRQGIYHGIRFRYPARLEAIASGIRDGTLKYFQDFHPD